MLMQISKWLARVEEGRVNAMSRARPRALQHLKDEDEQFWDAEPAKRQVPRMLDLQEAKEYDKQPLVLPSMQEIEQRQRPSGRPSRSNRRS